MTSIQHPEPPADIVARFTGQKVEVRYVYLEPKGAALGRRMGDGKAFPPYIFKIAEGDKTVADLTAAARDAGLRLYVWLPFDKYPHYSAGSREIDPGRLTAHVLSKADAGDWRIASFKIG